MIQENEPDLDVAIIGAGFAGIYALHKVRNDLGLRARAFDRAGGVGGTWYWNRYPGVQADTESLVYRYSFDRETFAGWDWNARYATGDQMLRYLEAIVNRYDLGRDIRLNTSIESAAFDEVRDVWVISTDGGEELSTRYLINALGVLSAAHIPDYPGKERFRGRIVHTAQWPSDLVLDGKRIGVIGTGSTGTQFITAASRVAGHLTVFQRSAQYCVPSGNTPLTDEVLASYLGDYQRNWERIKASRIACGFTESEVPAMSVSPEERQRVFQASWDAGNGFRFMFGTFADIAVDPDANAAAADFIRSKIREIVIDPETAAQLCPTDLYAKRPIATDHYYETYNRNNVNLVSTRDTPIAKITPDGILTSDGVEHPLDIIVFATGFEAVEGSYNRIDIRGRDGKTIHEHWKTGPTSYLGVSLSGFPNMFMVMGPNSVFSNLPPGIETQVEWIAGLIETAQQQGQVLVEATEEAESSWSAACDTIARHTLFPRVKSWIFGANIPGKQDRTLFFFGGLGEYRRQLDRIAAAGYDGFTLTPSRQPART